MAEAPDVAPLPPAQVGPGPVEQGQRGAEVGLPPLLVGDLHGPSILEPGDLLAELLGGGPGLRLAISGPLGGRTRGLFAIPRRLGGRAGRGLAVACSGRGIPRPLRGAPLPDGRASQAAEQERQHAEAVRRREGRLPPRPLRRPLDGPGRAHAHRLAGGEPPQVVDQRLGRRVSIDGVLLEALQADQLQVARDPGVPLRRRFGQVRQHRGERLDHALAGEGRLARQQGVQDRPEPIDVGRRGDRAATPGGLLGAHVGRRAHDRAAGRQFDVGLDPLGQAEIGDVRMAFPVDEDVRRLQVAVEDASQVGVLDGLGGLDHQGGCGTGPFAERFELIGEVAPLDELHAEIALAVVLAHLVDRHDAGVVEQGDRLGLVLEPEQVGVIGQHAGLDHLECDGPVEVDLPSLVDDAHAAAAQLLEELVVAEVADGRAARQVGLARAASGCPGRVAGVGRPVAGRVGPRRGTRDHALPVRDRPLRRLARSARATGRGTRRRLLGGLLALPAARAQAVPGARGPLGATFRTSFRTFRHGETPRRTASSRLDPPRRRCRRGAARCPDRRMDGRPGKAPRAAIGTAGAPVSCPWRRRIAARAPWRANGGSRPPGPRAGPGVARGSARAHPARP